MTAHRIRTNTFRPATARPERTGERAEVRALSADAALLQGRKTAKGDARIHSVFERVLNIEAGDDRLVTLAHRASDDAPDTVVVDLDSWAAQGCVSGTEVRLTAGRILVGDGLVIALECARPWRGRLPAYPRDDSTLRANLPLAHNHLRCHGEGAGCSRSGGTVPSALDEAVFQAVRGYAQGLYEALAGDDEPLALEHASRLVGLGPGLTPAGDDFLVGLLTALNIPDSPRHAWRRIGARVVECAQRQTHLISAATLRHAATGRARASVIGLCSALMHESSTTMLGALTRVISIGSSSGTDIAVGVLTAFRLHLGPEEARQARPVQHQPPGDVHGS